MAGAVLQARCRIASLELYHWDNSKLMKSLFVRPNSKITLGDFRVFLEQFARGESLESLSLCNSIKSEWWQFVDQRSFLQPIEIKKLGSNTLPDSNPPSEPGIYAIFARRKALEFPLCFYVGISTRDIRSRLRTHLGPDIKTDYRSSFKNMEEFEEIFICSTTVPDLLKKTGTRQELELLEHCLTVLLRPRFLILAAINARVNGGAGVNAARL